MLEICLECLKKLHEFHKDYSLAPDKLEIKKEILSDNQLKLAKDYYVSISNVKTSVPNFSNK